MACAENAPGVVCPPRSARVKIAQLMASIIFFLESVAFSSIISGTISLRMLIYRAFAPGLPWVGHAFYTAK